jgi:hypothetical protein
VALFTGSHYESVMIVGSFAQGCFLCVCCVVCIDDEIREDQFRPSSIGETLHDQSTRWNTQLAFRSNSKGLYYNAVAFN